MSPLKSGSATDNGMVRECNEDAVLALPDRGIFAVIDGVGGHRSGELAAAIAKERLERALSRRPGQLPPLRLREAFAVANNAIFDESVRDATKQGMGCVATVALVKEQHVTIGHVGDTRAYKIHQGSIQQITKDHSPVGEREADGRLTEEEAMRHPRRNEIFRDLGSEHREPEDEDFVDLYQQDFEPDAALLLCSDGLTDLIPSERIRALVEEAADTFGGPNTAADTLIQAANDAGGKDNVSVVVVFGETFRSRRFTPAFDPSPTRPTRAHPAAEWPLDAPVEPRAGLAPTDTPTSEPELERAEDSAPAPTHYAGAAHRANWFDRLRRLSGRGTGANETTVPSASHRTSTPAAPQPSGPFAVETGPQHTLSLTLRRRLLSWLLAGLVIALAAIVLAGLLQPLGDRVLALAGLGSAPSAGVLRVGPPPPGDPTAGEATFATISEALRNARAGQTIRVADGIYEEQLVLRSGITIASVRRGGAILHAPTNMGTSNQRIAVSAQGVSGARLVGLRIVGDTDHPLDFGLQLHDSEVEIDDVTIIGAQLGVDLKGTDRSRLRHVVIEGGARGVVVASDTDPRIESCLFVDLSGVGVTIGEGARPRLSNNRFVHLTAAAILSESETPLENVFRRWNDFVDTTTPFTVQAESEASR